MEVRYHLKDWMADWEEILRQSLTVPRENENEHIRAYFLSRYPVPSEAKWRCLRIFAALRYLEARAHTVSIYNALRERIVPKELFADKQRVLATIQKRLQ